MPRLATFTVCMALAAGLAQPAAASSPRTRLIERQSENYLLITGSRDDTASEITINGRPVMVEGGREWRVRLPIDTIRSWSAPHARAITVAVDGSRVETALPLGMLGRADRLAMLVVTAK
ncbi:hypothetical protein [Sphingobium olei]|uniref:Uncharacterized protein n=1 Tax=Sphingobium olei TaxID=420955 RepID=A0ABW3P5W0_9SPHN